MPNRPVLTVTHVGCSVRSSRPRRDVPCEAVARSRDLPPVWTACEPTGSDPVDPRPHHRGGHRDGRPRRAHGAHHAEAGPGPRRRGHVAVPPRQRQGGSSGGHGGPPGRPRRGAGTEPARTGRRLAGVPAARGARHPVAGRRAPQPLPPRGHPPAGRPVAASAAAQPPHRRGLPRRARRAGPAGRGGCAGVQGVHRLPAGAPAAGGGRGRAGTAPPEEPFDEGDAAVPNDDQRVSLDEYPTLVRLAEGLRTHDASADFESALESLLDRLDGELSQ